MNDTEKKMVRVDWLDSMTCHGSLSKDEYETFASNFSDVQQVSVGVLTHDCESHICVASMVSIEGNVGVAVKIPKFAITKIQELKINEKNKNTKKR